MKYMTFDSSCAFAGVANLLAAFGVDAEDRDIALGMKLPLLFARGEEGFLAGPMLQSARWFDLYLRPLGFCLEEREFAREEIPARLEGEGRAMLGLRVSPRSKHAVVFTGREGGKYRFLNNKREGSDEPEELILSAEELLERLDGRVMVAALRPCPPEEIDFRPVLRESLEALADLREEIAAFCSVRRTGEELAGALDPLFRPILLDGLNMLALGGREDLADRLRPVQRELLALVRAGRGAVPAEELSMEVLLDVMERYRAWIAEELEKLEGTR